MSESTKLRVCFCYMNFVAKTGGATPLESEMKLTHCGPVTQICVYTLQLCKTDDANLRFNTRLVSTYYTLNYAIHGALLGMVLLTNVYRNVTSLRVNDL
jgi:hypothetical protein